MRYFALLLLLQGYSSYAQVRTQTVEPIVQQVTIFSSGARVERSATVNLLPGRTELTFSGLSNQLDPQSIQLSADGNMTLLSVQTARDYLGARKLDAEERTFISRIESTRDRIAADQKLLQVYQNEEAMLVKNQEIGGQAGVKTLELKEALDLHRQRLTEVYNKQLEIQKRLDALKQEDQRLRMQLSDFGKKKDSVQFSVIALIDTKETKAAKFSLRYNVKDAGWYPNYDVRVVDVSKPLKVLMNANVFQRSGETWKDVSLLLSTGNPTGNSTPSILQPWMLGYYDPSVSFRNQRVVPGSVSGRITDETGAPVPFATINIKGTRTSVTADENGFFRLNNVPENATLIVTAVGMSTKEIVVRSGYYGIALSKSSHELQEVVVTALGVRTEDGFRQELAGKVAGLQVVNVATQYQPTTTVYKIEDRYTLETDGKTTTIGIREFDVAAGYEYFAAPKLDPSAFLTARIADWQQYDLQSGEASLYFEGSFLGKTYIDLGTAGDTIALSLGKDNGVRVSRRLVKEFTSKRFIGSNRTDSRQFEITVRNTKKVPVSIVVTDQFPVSVNKDIEIEDKKTSPEASIDKDSGIITWKLELAPGQERKMTVSYVVKYPKDRKVVLE